MTNWQKVETAKEIRLWLGQIVAPIVGVVALSPSARNWLKGKAHEVGDFIKGLFNR